MYCELQPFREALSHELKASLFPAEAGIDPNKLLETYLDRLTMYTGVDVADQTFTVLALDAAARTGQAEEATALIDAVRCEYVGVNHALDRELGNSP